MDWMTNPSRATSPDCAVGKHTACSGDAWDDANDQPAPCDCTCHTHIPGQLEILT